MNTSVDNKHQYNNMDFDTLFDEMLDFFKNNPNSPIKDFDFEGSNIREMIRILSYTSNLSLFHTSIAMNEMYFSTARLRKNLLKMLSPYSYTPRRNVSSKKFLTINNSNAVDINIPEFTAFTATGNEILEDKIFYTLESYQVPANGTMAIQVYQSNTGKLTQNFDLVINVDNTVDAITLEIENLSEDYFKVQTTENGTVINWFQYEDLDSFQNALTVDELNILPEENIYFLDEIDKGYSLTFSETGIGAVPDPDDGQTLTILYMENDGTISNGFSTSNFSFVINIIGLSIISDTNILGANTAGPSAGGQDKETLAELKENTISVFNTQNRAVTEFDYTKLGQQIPLIGSTGDIKAYGGEKYSTGERLGNVYIIVRPSTGEQYFFTAAQILTILEFYLKYRITGITPIIQNPHYINSIIYYNYIFKSLINNTAEVTSELNDIIRDFYVSNFGETIYVPALVESLNSHSEIESAFIKDNYRILFDTLSTLTGTYKLIPMLSTEISDFILSDGSFFSNNVYGSTSGSNYGTVIFVNEEQNYIIVDQVAGITNTNFVEFQKGTSYINTRKDITNIIYNEVSGENNLYISGTDGFLSGNYLSSISSGGSTSSAVIQSIEKDVTNQKNIWLQLDSISGLTVGDILVNAAGIEGTIIEIDLINVKVWIIYTNGSNYVEGTDLDITTYSSPGAYEIAKRSTLILDEDLTTITVGDTLTNASSIVGTVESINTVPAVGSQTVTVWWSNTSNFADNDVLTQAGSGTLTFNVKVTGGVGTITNGLGTISYKTYLRNGVGAAFEVGQLVEPGDTWGYNDIAAIPDSQHIVLSDGPFGLTIGDTICESGGTNTTEITNITSLTLEVVSTSGFTIGEQIHAGLDWSALITETIVKVDPIYNDTIDKLEVSDATSLVVGKFLVGENGIGEIDVGGISGTEIDLINIVGTFEIGTDNVHQVDTDSDSFEPLYTLNGNIEDFSTEYILEVDTENNLPLFINKMDTTDTGMLDASISELICGYSYIFNSVSNINKDSLILKLAYGSDILAAMETEQNTEYEIILKIDSAISTLAVGDYVICSNDAGTTTVTGYVYEIDTSGGLYYITIRYDEGIWLLGGSSNNIQKGTTWTAATNEITELGDITSPAVIDYVESIVSDNTDFIASVNIATGDVAFRRAKTVISLPIVTANSIAKTLTFTNSSTYLSSGTINVWDIKNIEWLTWDYTSNSGTVLTGVDSIPSGIIDGLTAIQDKTDVIRRSEFRFTNKIDKLALGNRSLFYSSLDLIKEFS